MRFIISSWALPALLSAVALLWGAQPSQGVEQQVRAVTIVAKDGSFTPSQIQAQPGETVHVTLTNQGKLPHNIVFLLPGGSVGLSGDVAPGESASLDLSVPDKPGQFVFYCPVDHHRAMGMEGRLIVGQTQ